MSGLIDAVAKVTGHDPVVAREAVLATANWLDEPKRNLPTWVAQLLRVEVAPPPPPTAEDVIVQWLRRAAHRRSGDDHDNAQFLITALLGAGFTLERKTP